jgi:hypothetical protein
MYVNVCVCVCICLLRMVFLSSVCRCVRVCVSVCVCVCVCAVVFVHFCILLFASPAPSVPNCVFTFLCTWGLCVCVGTRPSLTCQWFPDLKSEAGKDYSVQRLLLGTNTSGEEDEFLMIAEVQLPNEDVEREATSFVEKGEAGGFGHGSCKISVTHKFPVEAEVNRARYMPQVRGHCCVCTRLHGGICTSRLCVGEPIVVS